MDKKIVNTARDFLEGKYENLEEGNDDKYLWADINNALMQAGFGPKVIIRVLKNLKGKKVK